MREIGGYIELDTYTGTMIHDDGIKLNCGRGAFEYVIKAKNIKNILMPKFMCDSCDRVLAKNNVNIRYYSVGLDFKPLLNDRNKDEYLYVVNYYGQLSNEYLMTLGDKVIVDNAQAYFQNPIEGTDTLYTCRKFFGVADGAILYTDNYINIDKKDESFERMHFLLGRYEKCASEFYREYVDNNHFFANEPIKRMSKLTENLLHGIDYEMVKNGRTKNFKYLHEQFKNINRLNLDIPQGAFMYPLYLANGEEIRKKLQTYRIYIPTLWPAVFKRCSNDELEYDMAKNILPIPVDQRYTIEDMGYITNIIKTLK